MSTGIYKVTATVTDAAGESASATFEPIVIYNPKGGFITGSGWINSPMGAYTPDPTLTGNAIFSFALKYQKGAKVPSGDVYLQVANLNFKSTSFDWLVISGSKAQYQGTGTINDAGNYGFLIAAMDSSPDKIRIKIWDKSSGEAIYDNQAGASETADPTTIIQGGSIVIHKAK
jgi:hypothetical protein